MSTSNATAARSATGATTLLDAVIIGAGFSGLYQLHKLRGQGMKVRAIEAAPEVGGTWYWNCYPGARTDSPSHVYQFWFSDELLDEWDWQERYPGQQEAELESPSFCAMRWQRFARWEKLPHAPRLQA